MITVTSALDAVDIEVTNDVSTHAQTYAQGGPMADGPYVRYGTTVQLHRSAR